MLGHCLAAAEELEPERLIVVVGHQGETVAAHARELVPEVIIVVQDYLGGTGHAVRVALETVGLMSGTIVVTYADTPLLRGLTLAGLVQAEHLSGAAAAILTTRPADPTGYGRIIRDASGQFHGIIEQADATGGPARDQRDQLRACTRSTVTCCSTRSSGSAPTTRRARNTSPTPSACSLTTATRW